MMKEGIGIEGGGMKERKRKKKKRTEEAVWGRERWKLGESGKAGTGIHQRPDCGRHVPFSRFGVDCQQHCQCKLS